MRHLLDGAIEVIVVKRITISSQLLFVTDFQENNKLSITKNPYKCFSLFGPPAPDALYSVLINFDNIS